MQPAAAQRKAGKRFGCPKPIACSECCSYSELKGGALIRLRLESDSEWKPAWLPIKLGGMSDAHATPDEAARRAREILERDVDRRVRAVEVLTSAANESDAAEERAREAKALHERAWSAALNSGWSEKDLRATGARAPGAAMRRARRKSSVSAVPSATQPVNHEPSA
jgi:hypothetical protein